MGPRDSMMWAHVVLRTVRRSTKGRPSVPGPDREAIQFRVQKISFFLGFQCQDRPN